MVVVTAAATEWATATSTFPSPSRPEWQREPRNFDFDYGLKGWVIISSELGIATRFDPNRGSWGCLRHLGFSTNRSVGKQDKLPLQETRQWWGRQVFLLERKETQKKTNCLLVEMIWLFSKRLSGWTADRFNQCMSFEILKRWTCLLANVFLERKIQAKQNNVFAERNI